MASGQQENVILFFNIPTLSSTLQEGLRHHQSPERMNTFYSLHRKNKKFDIKIFRTLTNARSQLFHKLITTVRTTPSQTPSTSNPNWPSTMSTQQQIINFWASTPVTIDDWLKSEFSPQCVRDSTPVSVNSFLQSINPVIPTF